MAKREMARKQERLKGGYKYDYKRPKNPPRWNVGGSGSIRNMTREEASRRGLLKTWERMQKQPRPPWGGEGGVSLANLTREQATRRGVLKTWEQMQKHKAERPKTVLNRTTHRGNPDWDGKTTWRGAPTSAANAPEAAPTVKGNHVAVPPAAAPSAAQAGPFAQGAIPDSAGGSGGMTNQPQ